METFHALIDAAGFGRVDLMTIDCEGMEYEIFSSLDRESLQRFGAIACEYHPEPGHSIAELDGVFQSSGFAVRRPPADLGVLWATRTLRD